MIARPLDTQKILHHVFNQLSQDERATAEPKTNSNVMSILLVVKQYAGRVACCPLVSHGEYADGTDRQTDGRTPDRYITLMLDAASVITASCAKVLC